MCDGLIQTLGRVTFGGKVDHPFTAHPKIDPKTGAGHGRLGLYLRGHTVSYQLTHLI